MLESISWAEYLTGCAAAAMGYYAIVGALFYRKEILSVATKPPINPGQTKLRTVVERDRHRSTSNILPEHPLMPRVHECVDELTALISQLAHEKPTTAVITSSLQKLLQKYSDLSDSSFQEYITQLIATQCATQLGTPLSETVYQQLWP